MHLLLNKKDQRIRLIQNKKKIKKEWEKKKEEENLQSRQEIWTREQEQEQYNIIYRINNIYIVYIMHNTNTKQ